MSKSKIISLLVLSVLLAGCGNNSNSDSDDSLQVTKVQKSTAKVESTEVAHSESEKANALFEEIFMNRVMRSPIFQSYLGIKKDNDKWDDLSEAHAVEDHELAITNLTRVNKIDVALLDEQTKVSLRLQKENLQNRIDDYKWRYHNYPLNQMFGFHSRIPSLLINQHKIVDEKDAEAYIARLNAIPRLFIQVADDRAGAWKFPEGKAFFNNALERTTTTDLTSREIHETGLKEVERIHDEMRVIMQKVNFEGDLKAFFEFMRVDKQFFYDETQESKDKYLSEATALIDDMKSRLDELFIVKPKADLTVKAVEAFREKSAGKAFYQRPSMDGTRPGVYYANLYRMSDMPTYQMAALAYHEGIPGHHMQLAIAGELGELPKFRKFGGYTAYTEGWGLYSEQIPKEIGLYQDPYSDFGRLAMELWRACRLVVDTGIHVMEWTREQGIDYYVNNTPNPKPDAVKMVERHIVAPSQATAYKIGMLKILELREKAKTQLADKFDIRKFHDVILKNGPLPLNVLEEYVNEFIKQEST